MAVIFQDFKLMESTKMSDFELHWQWYEMNVVWSCGMHASFHDQQRGVQDSFNPWDPSGFSCKHSVLAVKEKW